MTAKKPADNLFESEMDKRRKFIRAFKPLVESWNADDNMSFTVFVKDRYREKFGDDKYCEELIEHEVGVWKEDLIEILEEQKKKEPQKFKEDKPKIDPPKTAPPGNANLMPMPTLGELRSGIQTIDLSLPGYPHVGGEDEPSTVKKILIGVAFAILGAIGGFIFCVALYSYYRG